MQLIELLYRKQNPAPWSEVDKIPWNEPGFSRRMLKEHLSQDHDAASRKLETIDEHVKWIHHTLLKNKPSKILDLGCGPGFYTSRLAKLGHTCSGVDFSPASIEYAKKTAVEENNGCTYHLNDLRSFDFGSGFNLVLLIYGEFNTFRKTDARAILEKAREALNPGGQLLIELNSWDCLRAFGKAPAGWHTSRCGLFSDQPHLYLEESFWNEDLQAATCRMFVIDLATGEVQQMNDNHQAYQEAELRKMVLDCGFSAVEFLPAWPDINIPADDDFLLMTCQK